MSGAADRPGAGPGDELILAHSERALQLFGDTPQGAHWPNEADRLKRFDVMLAVMAADSREPRVLCDLGCGTGELLAHIRRLGLDHITYIGIDRSTAALEHARAKFPEATFLSLNVNDVDADLTPMRCDYLVANGLFTAKWELTHAQMTSFLETTLRRVWPLASRGIAFNVMSTAVDWQRDDLFHVSMDDLARLLHSMAGRRVVLRADYGLYEYTAYAYKDSSPSTTDADAKPAADLESLVPPQVLRQARGNHVYQQHQVKQALLGAFGRDLAFERYQAALAIPYCDALKPLALLPLREAGRNHGLAYLEQHAGGQEFIVPAPRVIGEGNHRRLSGQTRARFVTCLANASVRSRSSCVEIREGLVLDFAQPELSGIDDQLEVDPAIFQREGNTAYTIASQCSDGHLRLEEAFCLVGCHTWAFGHWMWEYLPRYVAATCVPGVPAMPVLIDAGMPAQHRQALEALLPAGATVLELPGQGVADVGRLWCAPTPMYMPLYEVMNERFRWDLLAAEPLDFAGVVAEMKRRLPPADADAPSPGRIFLARKSMRHRKLLNHLEIEAIAAGHGFAVVHPEDMSFSEQLRLVQNASWIIGPEGSAMFLALFAQAGTRVGILNHPYTQGLPVLTGLFEALALEVTVVTGPAMSVNEQLPHFVDYKIGAGQFEAYLAEDDP